MKKEYEIVFVVLTYRNTTDVVEFIESCRNKISNYKIIIVNSYYDDITDSKIEQIALSNECDFIKVPNNGYGCGNNAGVDYAKDNYDFKFLIISNPDIEILKFDIRELEGFENCIVGPYIKTLNGKNQNPYYHYKIALVEKLKYYSYIYNNRLLFYSGILINKFIRELVLLLDQISRRNVRQIYAAHGSFVIIGRPVLNVMPIIFNPDMFLFSEENHLAMLARSKGIKILLSRGLKVLHKEDGSVGISEFDINAEEKKAYLTYFNNWMTK